MENFKEIERQIDNFARSLGVVDLVIAAADGENACTRCKGNGVEIVKLIALLAADLEHDAELEPGTVAELLKNCVVTTDGTAGYERADKTDRAVQELLDAVGIEE